MAEPGRPRLRDGVVIRRVPFGGAFVIDAAHLAAVEIDDELADLLTHGSEPMSLLPPAITEGIRQGVADGWLVMEPAEGDQG